MRIRYWAVAAALATAPALAQPPRPVSPGALTGSAPVDSRCPTFTWSTSPGAMGYELAVFAAEAGEDPEPATAAPLLHERLPAGTGSWTPAADQCLERDAVYAWSIRAETPAGAGAWSRPALFEVAPTADALEMEVVVRRVLDAIEEEERAARDRRPGRAATELRRSLPPAPDAAGAGEGSAAGAVSSLVAAAAAAPVQLSVDGGVQASRFVFGESLETTVFVGAPEFQVTPSDDEDVWELDQNGSGFVRVSDTVPSVKLVAQVPALPPGATITGFRCSWLDSDAEVDVFVDFDLLGRLDISVGAFLVAELSEPSNGASNTIRFTSAGPLQNEVFSARTSYHISGRWVPGAAGDTLRFYGCTVDLEVSELRL